MEFYEIYPFLESAKHSFKSGYVNFTGLCDDSLNFDDNFDYFYDFEAKEVEEPPKIAVPPSPPRSSKKGLNRPKRNSKKKSNFSCFSTNYSPFIPRN